MHLAIRAMQRKLRLQGNSVAARPDLATVTALAETLPAGPARDELLRLAQVGAVFCAQQRGRRRGFLHNYVAKLAGRLPAPPTFADLLEEMELEAARRALDGESASPVEKVNRVWELVTIHIPGRASRQVPFATLRNVLTVCRKNVYR